MTWLFRQLVRLLPAEVRARHGEALDSTFRARVEHARANGGAWAAWRAAGAEYWDTLCAAVEFRSGADPFGRHRRPSLRRQGALEMTASLMSDLRFALRLIARQRAYSLTIILTLALGIGANTAVFSAIYGVMLRPLPFRDAEQLVSLFVVGSTTERGEFSPLDAFDLAAGTRALKSLAVINSTTENLTGAGEPRQLTGALVSGNFFDTLGAEPAAGRMFSSADAASDPRVVVIAERVWRTQFGSDPSRIGQTIQLDGVPYRLAAVMPDAAAFPDQSDFWRPLELRPNALLPSQRGARYLQAIARLMPGVSPAQARDELSALYRNLTPARRASTARLGVAVVGLRTAEVEAVRPALLALGGGVIVLLLIACSNIANLTLTRALARTGEFALRASLGAGRRRIVRQLLVESATLTALGTLVGVFLAVVSLPLLLRLAPAGLPGFDRVGVDGAVLAFAAALAIATAMLVGLYPAWKTSRVDLVSVSRGAGGRSVTSGGSARRTLAVAEVALAVVLLGSAGLLVQTMWALGRQSPGFDPNHVLTFSLSLPGTPYDSPERRARAFADLTPALSSLPGVIAAGVGAGTPFTGFNAFSGFTLAGIDTPAEGATTSLRVVSGDYFKALAIPLVAGRLLNESDRSDTQPVALINQRLAARYFHGEDPVGHLINIQASIAAGAPKGPRLIVGVVGDVRSERIEREAAADVYLPFSQQAVGTATVVIRTAGDPMEVLADVRRRLKEVDPALPLADVKPMLALVGESASEQRFTATLLTIFAGIAAALVVVGLYGVFSVGVTQRLREVGIRLALGATGPGVLRLFLAESLVLATVGVLLGLVGLRFASGMIASLLVGVAPTDAATFAFAAASLAAVAMGASYLPARRAAKLNPVSVLNRF